MNTRVNDFVATTSASRSEKPSDCPVSPALRVKRVSSFREWEAHRAAWADLTANAIYPNIFSLWEWQSTWWEHFGVDKKLFVLIVEDGQRLLGALPLYSLSVTKKGDHRTLRLVGYGECVYPDYLGFIVRKGYVEQASTALADYFRREFNWQELLLEDCACDDPGTSRFVEIMAGGMCAVRRSESARRYCRLEDTYDKLLQRLSGHNRQKKRNRVRQAIKKHGAHLVECDSDDYEHAFDIMVRLTELSRSRKGKTSSFANVPYARFQKALLAKLMPTRQCRVYFVLYDGVPAAFWYVLVWKGKCYAYQAGCDHRVHGSPGDVALQIVICRAIEDSCTEFDFLRGEHSYKEAYPTDERECVTVWIWRKGVLGYMWCRVREALARPLYRNLKRWIRQDAKAGKFIANC